MGQSVVSPSDGWSGPCVLATCHTRGMPRTRVSTTVDAELLTAARAVRAGAKDHVVFDEALAALVAAHRAAQVDASYEAGYAEHPIAEPDQWGDVAGWRRSAGRP